MNWRDPNNNMTVAERASAFHVELPPDWHEHKLEAALIAFGNACTLAERKRMDEIHVQVKRGEEAI